MASAWASGPSQVEGQARLRVASACRVLAERDALEVLVAAGGQARRSSVVGGRVDLAQYVVRQCLGVVGDARPGVVVLLAVAQLVGKGPLEGELGGLAAESRAVTLRWWSVCGPSAQASTPASRAVCPRELRADGGGCSGSQRPEKGRRSSAGFSVVGCAGEDSLAMHHSSVSKRFLLCSLTGSTQSLVQQHPEHIGAAQP